MTGRQRYDLVQEIARFEKLAESAGMAEALALRRTIKRLRAALAADHQVDALRHQAKSNDKAS